MKFTMLYLRMQECLQDSPKIQPSKTKLVNFIIHFMILLFTGVYYLITKHRLIVCSDNYVGYTGCIGCADCADCAGYVGHTGCIGYVGFGSFVD